LAREFRIGESRIRVGFQKKMTVLLFSVFSKITP